MRTEITEATTASLTLAENKEFLAITDERHLTDEQFDMVCRIADAPPPAIELSTDDDVRAVIGSLSTVKKRRNASIQEGRLQLGLYRKVLTGISKAALIHAGEVFLCKPGWMPEPADMLLEANRFLDPARRAHGHLKFLARTRRQRIFQERCDLIKKRSFPVDQFHTLTEQEIKHGINHRALLRDLDGSVIPWSLEDEKRLYAQRGKLLQSEGGALDERDIHARTDAASDGSVGNIAGNLLDGMEINDGQ